MEVQTVTSPGGTEAWLVEDSAVPMFALHFAFEGGSAQDPVGKDGVANFVALVLNQGAGGLDAIEFRRRIEELAVRVEFTLSTDAVIGRIEALPETRDAAARLLNLVLTRPRLDHDTVERVRQRLLTFHAGEARRPFVVANAQWNAVAFAGHPYARRIYGSEGTVSEITAEDLKAYCRRVFAKDRLKVVAVGDITAKELSRFVDELSGGLPANSDLVPVPNVTPVLGGRLRVAEMDMPQSLVAFGMGAVPYDSSDFIPAYVLSYIVGGHGVTSRLASELRQKRGLAFSARTWLEHHRHAAVFRGGLATRNDRVGESLEIVREEMQKMADGHLSQAELDHAKGYLIGSYPLAFGSNSKIAAQLLEHSMSGFGPDFFESRKAMIAAVTLEELKVVARYMLNPENLIISVAGTPALQPVPKT